MVFTAEKRGGSERAKRQLTVRQGLRGRCLVLCKLLGKVLPQDVLVSQSFLKAVLSKLRLKGEQYIARLKEKRGSEKKEEKSVPVKERSLLFKGPAMGKHTTRNSV